MDSDIRRASVTLEDVARRAGLSRAQVSRALRDDPGVRPETRRHAAAVADALGYRPNVAARALASRRSRTVGIVVGDILNPFEAMLARQCDAALRRAGFSSSLAINGAESEATVAAVRDFDGQRASALILIGATLDRQAVRIVAGILPTVYIGRHLNEDGIDSVSTDDEAGARLAVEHLLGLGHTRIGHITGGHGAGARRREAAFRAAMGEAGLAPLVIEGSYSVDAGSAGADALMARRTRPSAIFAANDLIGLGAISRLAWLGYRVPDEVAVVGFDDIPLAAAEPIALTTMRQKVPDLVDAAIAALLRRVGDRDAAVGNLLVPADLVVRRTTGRAPE